MAKFTVNCYYTYVATVEVEADTYEEAYAEGYNFCTDMPIEEHQFCGFNRGTVVNEKGETYEMN